MPWHDMRLAQAAESLGTDTAVGLSAEQAKKRLRQYGANRVRQTAEVPAGRRLFNALCKPCPILLLAAAVAGPIFDESGFGRSALLVALAALSVTLTMLRENDVLHIARRLEKNAIGKATVIRGGKKLEIAAWRVVKGDLLVLSRSDAICADARIISSSSLVCDESALFRKRERRTILCWRRRKSRLSATAPANRL